MSDLVERKAKELLVERGHWDFDANKFLATEEPIRIDQTTDTSAERTTELRFRYVWRDEGEKRNSPPGAKFVIPEAELRAILREAVRRGWIDRRWFD